MSADRASFDELLEHIRAFLGARAAVDVDLATSEDFLILDHLQLAIRAARSKGYGADLLVTVLRALFSDEPKTP